MRCCGTSFSTLKLWLTHKLKEHRVQLEQFGQALGDDPALAENTSARRIILQQLFGENLGENSMSKEQEERIIRLEEENRIMRGNLAAAGRPYIPGDAPTLPLDGRVEAIEGILAGQTSLLESVKSFLETLTVQADQDPEPTEPVHPIGFCQNESCETCVTQSRALLAAGRQVLSDEIDEALTLTGGEAIRNRVAQLVLQGQALLNHRAQVVEVIS